MSALTNLQDRRRARYRDLLATVLCGGFAAAAAGLSYAAIPLYSWFDRTVGLGGGAEVEAAAPPPSGDLITVRFDRTVAAALTRRPAPTLTSINVRLGPMVTVRYVGVTGPACAGSGPIVYHPSRSAVSIQVEMIACGCLAPPQPRPAGRRVGASALGARPLGAKELAQD